jgi:hypothetical protein
MEYHTIEERFLTSTLTSAIAANTTADTREYWSGFVNWEPNSVMFIDKITPWFPTITSTIIPIAAMIPNRISLPAPGGGVFDCEDELYKFKICSFLDKLMSWGGFCA